MAVGLLLSRLGRNRLTLRLSLPVSRSVVLVIREAR
nr:MAG TPA: hypothetical protein [Caudoviricetes sp.]